MPPNAGRPIALRRFFGSLVGELAAPLADKIFKGTPAGTIPVVTPEQYLYINYKEARRIGLNVPESLLYQAKAIVR